MRQKSGRLLAERALDAAASARGPRKAVRSVTVNAVELPLGWLMARGLITQRQFDAGEQLRSDWERAQMAPRVTMRWDPAPVSKSRGRSGPQLEPAERQMQAKRRFDDATASAGPGLSGILWRIVCSGEGMREAETALG